MKQGVLFIGHGTRLQTGITECLEFTQLVEQQVVTELATRQIEHQLYFDTCFLELQVPTIEQSIERFIEVGIEQIHIMPLFLFAAGHLKEDFPLIFDGVLAKYPFLRLSYGVPLSQGSGCSTVCADRLRQSGWIPGDRGASVLFVGRGSSDQQAHQDFCTLVEQVCGIEDIAPRQTQMAFLAGRGPGLDESLAQCLHGDRQIVYVVPVLLFRGRLSLGIGQKVQSWQEQQTHVKVRLTEHLGRHRYLIEWVADQIMRPLCT